MLSFFRRKIAMPVLIYKFVLNWNLHVDSDNQEFADNVNVLFEHLMIEVFVFINNIHLLCLQALQLLLWLESFICTVTNLFQYFHWADYILVNVKCKELRFASLFLPLIKNSWVFHTEDINEHKEILKVHYYQEGKAQNGPP